MKINCFDSQSDLKISPLQVQDLVKALLEMQQVECDEVAVYFVDVSTISSLHKDYFDDPSPTDCISFPLDSPTDQSQGPRILGEVFVCPSVAKSYAEDNKLDPYEETSLYIVHGILHLLGFDDQEEEEEKKMRKEEKLSMCYLKEKKVLLTP